MNKKPVSRYKIMALVTVSLFLISGFNCVMGSECHNTTINDCPTVGHITTVNLRVFFEQVGDYWHYGDTFIPYTYVNESIPIRILTDSSYNIDTSGKISYYDTVTGVTKSGILYDNNGTIDGINKITWVCTIPAYSVNTTIYFDVSFTDRLGNTVTVSNNEVLVWDTTNTNNNVIPIPDNNTTITTNPFLAILNFFENFIKNNCLISLIFFIVILVIIVVCASGNSSNKKR